jgi:DNA topoisomerase IB
MTRLRRSDPGAPGIARQRRGRGFTYVDPSGARIHDEATLERIRNLAIPPAWEDVWICADPDGHLQATGSDAAGRRQYRYHDVWRERRDRAKFRRIEAFGAALPDLRGQVSADLRRRGFPQPRILAGTVRLLDRGALRIGSEEYQRRNGSHGLLTLRRDHLRISGDVMTLRFPGKSGVEQHVRVRDAALARLLRGMRRAHDLPDLWAWHDAATWRPLHAGEVNEYIRDGLGDEASAKDFRTWHATVLAATTLAGHEPAEGKRAVTSMLREVATQLGNTPAVARSSYVDPRLVDRFLDEGRTVDVDPDASAEDVEAAVLRFIDGE